MANDIREVGTEMTGLGAAIYGGFFALAALWLFWTSDYAVSFRRHGEGRHQMPERSNAVSTPAHAEGFSPREFSHSSSK